LTIERQILAFERQIYKFCKSDTFMDYTKTTSRIQESK